MGMTYIKVFVDWLEAIGPLNDAERGRLFTALLEYAKTGNLPKTTGNERFLFPILKMQLDRDAQDYQSACQTNRANGKLGGRPAKNRAVFSETEKTQDKDKDKDKEKEKDKDSSLGAGAPERRVGRKRAPVPRTDSPGEIAEGRRRMEQFLLELRREKAEQDAKAAAESGKLPPPWINVPHSADTTGNYETAEERYEQADYQPRGEPEDFRPPARRGA